MTDQSSIPSSTPTAPTQAAAEPLRNSSTGYGFIRPSFSYLNSMNMPPGPSQQSSSPLVMQSEPPGSSASLQAVPSSVSMSSSPSFSYNNILRPSASFSTAQLLSTSTTTEQGLSAVGSCASSPAQSMLPPAPPLPSQAGSFVPGESVKFMAPPGPPVSDGNSAHAGNYSFNGSVHLKQTDQSNRTNVRADGTQEAGAIISAPTFMQSVSLPAHPNSGSSTTHFASNNFNSATTWIPPRPTFQVPIRMPNTPVTPGPPGMPPSAPSPSNPTIQASLLDPTPLIRTLTPTAPVFSSPAIQNHAVSMHPSPCPQVAPPGPWLQPPQITGFSRPPFLPYIVSGPYSMPTRGMTPLSVALPDIQPPGVSSSVSEVVAPTSSIAADDQSSMSSGQLELPPGVDNSKHVCDAETKDETPAKEQIDAWTAHRTESGTVYYYNALTGVSTYEKPPGFKGESDKATVQPTPVSWEKLAGTDWTLVTTNDGKRYYYNNITQLSSWQIPSEVTELRKKQEANALTTQSVSVMNTNTSIVTEKGSDPVSLSTPAANTGGRDSTPARSSSVSGSYSALDLIKKKLQDSGIPDSTSPGPALTGAMAVEINGSKPSEAALKGPQNENNKDKHKDTNGDGDMSNSSSDSDEEDAGPTKEECIIQFKEMLKERGVAPFSKWEKELPKIVFDPRFKAIQSHSARRALFEHYVRTRAEDQRKEKRAAQKAALDGFKQLLEETKEDIDHNTDYHTFKKRWGEDPRFQALDRKERESLLNERVLPLKRAAQERVEAERAAAVSNFKSMLQDKGDVTSSSRWSKVKDGLRNDPRYKAVKHEDREDLFNEYVAELKAAEEETLRKEKAKQDEEEKLRERERVLRKRKEREEQEVERLRQKARRKEAVESYQALLVETIKDPQASWTDSKPKLEKDPQGRTTNQHLDKSDLEKLFREHVKSLHERCVLEFKSLLTEVITTDAVAQGTEEGKTVMNSWSAAKQLLKKDPRYNKMPRKEREPLWRRHAEEIQRRQKLEQDQEADKLSEGKRKTSDSRRANDRR